MGERSGFTLIELLVSVVILGIAINKFTYNFVNYAAQLQWLESKRIVYAVVAPDLSKVIFSQYTYGTAAPASVGWRVQMQSLSTDGSGGLVATYTLAAP